MRSFMKNVLITASAGLGLSCAFMLANAQDSAGESSLGADARQQAGQAQHTSPSAAGMSTVNPGDRTAAVGDPNKTLGQDRWASATLCTDSSGISHRRGTRGFERCVSDKRSGNSDQAGTAGKESSHLNPPLDDTSNVGTPDSSQGSDSNNGANPSGIGGSSSGLGAGSNSQ
ncbi:MAG: hypothetical protein H7222_06765 [Methylotenera sp.]|nr:hypothetical protein [Oligoflexia bacterium]